MKQILVCCTLMAFIGCSFAADYGFGLKNGSKKLTVFFGDNILDDKVSDWQANQRSVHRKLYKNSNKFSSDYYTVDSSQKRVLESKEDKQFSDAFKFQFLKTLTENGITIVERNKLIRLTGLDTSQSGDYDIKNLEALGIKNHVDVLLEVSRDPDDARRFFLTFIDTKTFNSIDKFVIKVDNKKLKMKSSYVADSNGFSKQMVVENDSNESRWGVDSSGFSKRVVRAQNRQVNVSEELAKLLLSKI